eukprot:6472918-Amphidinium_carterae.1
MEQTAYYDSLYALDSLISYKSQRCQAESENHFMPSLRSPNGRSVQRVRRDDTDMSNPRLPRFPEPQNAHGVKKHEVGQLKAEVAEYLTLSIPSSWSAYTS